MITLTTLKSRLLQALQDPAEKRYNDSTLEEAIRQALDRINQRLPNIVSHTFTVSQGGRTQSVAGLEGCLYLVSVSINPDDGAGVELEPESGFSYRLQNGVSSLHFTGRLIPHAGDVICVTSAEPHTLADLDEAATTTLPAACVNALVDGAAGEACLQRAVALTETYGARTVEVTHLLDQSRVLMERFEQSLGQFKTLQEFGFPPGFALDADDRQTGGSR
jgi:hypothetical protein